MDLCHPWLKLPALMALQANSVTGTIVAAFPGQ